jgi:hypothetical protein
MTMAPMVGLGSESSLITQNFTNAHDELWGRRERLQGPGNPWVVPIVVGAFPR